MPWFRIALLAVAIGASADCAAGSLSRSRELPDTARCRALVHNEAAPALPLIDWRLAEDEATRAPLATACAAVGPSVYHASGPAESFYGHADDLVVVSWNVHVGGGDLSTFVDSLRSGAFTEGHAVRHFVLLLQEAFRSGPDVPQVLEAGVSVPSRIESHTPSGTRPDVLAAARSLGLHVFYVPSMRNGEEGGPRSEDRGNAILSTLPLAELTAMELPYARQRRVAAAATVSGVDGSGYPWSLRVVSAHLDATTGAKSLWLFSSVLRERQVHHLLRLLDADAPTVVGSDLNTWAGGPREPAFAALQRAFPKSRTPSDATFRFGLTLDYLFLRLPEHWRSEIRTLESRFGSDHHPLVALVRQPTGA